MVRTRACGRQLRHVHALEVDVFVETRCEGLEKDVFSLDCVSFPLWFSSLQLDHHRYEVNRVHVDLSLRVFWVHLPLVLVARRLTVMKVY